MTRTVKRGTNSTGLEQRRGESRKLKRSDAYIVFIQDVRY